MVQLMKILLLKWFVVMQKLILYMLLVYIFTFYFVSQASQYLTIRMLIQCLICREDLNMSDSLQVKESN